jgi:hypothetical protein
MKGDGDSSTSFWWRRWIEQSLSLRWQTLPYWSPATWIVILKSGARFGFCRVVGPFHVGLLPYYTHTLSTASGRSLENDGVADLFRHAFGLVKAFEQPLATGHHGYTGFDHGLLGSDLVAHGIDHGRRWSDKLDLVFAADLGETGVLGQESVTGVDGVRIRDLGGGHDMRNVEVRIKTGRLADTNGFVGEFDVQTFFICRRVDRDGLDAHLATGTNDPESDLSSVGNQYLFKHAVGLRIWICSSGFDQE